MALSMDSKLAFVLGALGVAVLTVSYAALPPIQGFEVHCDAAYSSGRLAGREWVAIRGAQSGPDPLYNASDGTTLLAPGCGHGTGGVLVRVRGDHRGFRDSRDHLVLDGIGLAGGYAGTWTWQDAYGRNQTFAVVAGTFEARPLLAPASLHGIGLAALAAALGITSPSPRGPWILAAGAGAGAFMAHALWASDAGLGIFFFGIPLLGLAPGLVAGVGYARWRTASWAAGLVYVLAFWVTFLTFAGAHPLTPDA